jgi:hypothetical protein
MNNMVNNRAKRRSSLPTVLLMLALGAGFATVGQAQDIPQVTVTVKSSNCSHDLMRDDMQTKATRAVWDTRISVAADLYARLYRQHRRSFQVAGGDSGNRG